MIYGDGDGKLFNRFTIALDVIGHELTHGVTQYTAALVYHDQSGALNEHISDVFGILVKQYALNQTAAQSDWLIGAGLFAPARARRRAPLDESPGTAYDDPSSARIRSRRTWTTTSHTTDDNGGVHINSGIPNHAFYLAATRARRQRLGGAGRIWYDALTTLLKPKATFRDCARATAAAAAKRYGVPASRNARWSKLGRRSASTSARS